jgi:hypothetical protein
MAKNPKSAVQIRIAEAAKRALAEAAERRRLADQNPPLPPEKGGRAGPEPTRYGDWEKKGIVSDF